MFSSVCPPQPPPPEADGYEVHEFLGRGSSGAVWRATQAGTLREVALKFLAPWQYHGLASVRFAREAEIAASLEHEHIARVFGSGEGAGGPWMAMELVEGPPVDRWVEVSRPSLRERVVLFHKICAAVRHAHQRGVIHRDLKPGNVLVAADGIPKVVDFGLACWQEGPSLDVTLTQQGEVFGSLAWMPPEQAGGRWAEVDALSDVYSLGAILYSLIGGRPPLDPGLPPAALLAAAQSGDRPRLTATEFRVPGDLEAIVEKCLSAAKPRRYQSAAALEADVGRWLAGEPVRARAASPLYWLHKKLRRHWGVAAAAAAMVLAASGLAWSYYQANQRLAEEKRRTLEREAAQAARTLQEAQELITQLLVELRPKLDAAGHPEWIEEAVARVAAFPWDIGGQNTAYDPRRFRALASMVTGELLAHKGQWGGALEAWHDAIDALKTLVPEHPDKLVFKEQLGQARLGEQTALLKLGFHKEAVAAGRKALEAFTPPPGQSVPPFTLDAMVETSCLLAEATVLAKGKLEEALEVVTGMAHLLPTAEPVGGLTLEAAGWHARIGREQARLTALVKSPAEADALAVKAVAAARHACQLTGDGELNVRLLVEALAVEADIALARDDVARATTRLTEASERLGGNKPKAPLTISAKPLREVAQVWERHAARMQQQGDLPQSIQSNANAITLWTKMRRRDRSDTGAMQSTARLLFANAQMWQRLGQPSEAVSAAASAASRHQACLDEVRADKMSACLDLAETLVFLAELKAVPQEDGSSWAARAATALDPVREKKSLLKPFQTARLASLESRLSATTTP